MRTDYIVITRDMLELGLKGSKLLVYALVFGFCKDAESDYHGSLGYIAGWCGVTRCQASIILKELVADGYLERTDVGGRPHYTVWKTKRLENQTERLENQTLPPHTPLSQESIETSLYKHIPTAGAREDKIAFGDKVQLTATEHAALVQRFGATDAARLVQILDDYLVNHPRKTYASHYRAILSWCVGKLTEEKITAQRLKNAQEAGARVNGQQQGAPVGNYVGLAEAKARREAIEAKYKLKQ